MENIRNFCIIAHIDHGKSTLADRFLEITNTISKREMKEQLLDTMELERERGITIKLQPVRMNYDRFILNLIDTPGHVDFSYEVSRSLIACEGAILVVDATQGIEAQTLANLYLAVDAGLEIIPVVNKIDLPAAEPEKVKKEIENLLGIPAEEVIEISAKEGTNIEKVLKEVCKKVPPPDRNLTFEEEKEKFKNDTYSLIFDSVYDSYRGVVIYIRVFNGEIKRGDQIHFLSTKKKTEVLEVGYFSPTYKKSENLKKGEVGYIITGLKDVGSARVGDTVFIGKDIKEAKALPGYKKVTPFVFAGIFPSDGSHFPFLRAALEKLSLSDSSLEFNPEKNPALGTGFRCGFLGLLHLDIIRERLEREYDLNLVVTAPSVTYEIIKKNGESFFLSNPAEWPDPAEIEEIREPYVRAEIMSTKDSVGKIMDLCQNSRGIYKSVSYPSEERALITYELPLAEIISDFYDELKSVSSGYASMNYDFLEFRKGNLVKLDIIIAEDIQESLSSICHKDFAHSRGNRICKKLKDTLSREQFAIKIQAAIGSKVVARETLSAFRKDVTAKLYGGDVTRKRKLLEKQKKGKKRMLKTGKLNIPKEAFLSVIKRK